MGTGNFTLRPSGGTGKESSDLRPVPSNHPVGAQVTTPGKEFKSDSGASGESFDGTPGDVRVVLSVEHQDFVGEDLADVMKRVVEVPGVELFPVLVG